MLYRQEIFSRTLRQQSGRLTSAPDNHTRVQAEGVLDVRGRVRELSPQIAGADEADGEAMIEPQVKAAANVNR